MARKKIRRSGDECALDMTPMIDVVFQLIIFFVVTLKTSVTFKEDIVLEWGKNGPELKEQSIPPLIIEIDQRGWISMNAAQLSEGQLRNVLRNRINRMGTNFPLLVRADYRTEHKDVKKVMDICTAAGVWKLSFVAMVKKSES